MKASLIPSKLIIFIPVLLDQVLLAESGVDLWSVEDAPGPVGVVQRGEGLLHVDGGRGHRGDDGGLGSTTERILDKVL